MDFQDLLFSFQHPRFEFHQIKKFMKQNLTDSKYRIFFEIFFFFW